MSGKGLPKLLFVGAFPPKGRVIFGGQVTACRALLESSFPGYFELHLLDTTQISNPAPSFLRRLALAVRRFCYFIHAVERHRPAGVLLFMAIGASVVEKGAMAWYARFRGVPSVVFPRGGGLLDAAERSSIYRKVLPAIFGGAAAVLCQTPRWQEFVVDVLHIPRDRAPVVKNWAATTELIAVGEGRQIESKVTTRMLFVGWIEEQKGVFDLLTVLHRIKDSRDFLMDFVGDGCAAATAKQFVSENGLSEKVRFHGWLSREAIADVLREADIFVLPSWEEGLPNAMIEAFAARVPVIVTRVGGVPDVAVDGVNALLVQARNPDELESAVIRMIDDDELRSRLSSAAFKTAVADFSVESAVAQLVHHLDSAFGLERIAPVRV